MNRTSLLLSFVALAAIATMSADALANCAMPADYRIDIQDKPT